MMKNKTAIIILILTLSVIAVSVLVFMCVLLFSDKAFFFSVNKVSSELVVDKTYENIPENIDITSSIGDIYIYESEEELAKLVIYGEKEYTKVEDEKDLTISYKSRPCFGICFDKEKTKIELTLPKNYKGKIKIHNKFGDIKIGNFSASNIDIKSDYGDTKIDEAHQIDIHSSAGDIDVNSVTKLKAVNNLGDIKIRNVLSFMDVEANCGNIEIENATLDTNSKIENSMGDIIVEKTNSIRIDGKTSLGEVEIRKNDYKADVILNINNSCGDIEVNN